MSSSLLLIAFAVLSLAPVPGRDPGALDPRAVAADSLFRAGDAEGALRRVEAMLEGDARSYEALWRAASYTLAIGVTAEEIPNGRPPIAWYRMAEGYAQRGKVEAPERVEARYWEVAALGRQALTAGPAQASALAERIRAGSLEILARDPDHPGAHNALGRLHLEIMSLSGMSRVLGRAFTGAAILGEASWPLAETHLRRAVELDPGMAMYRLDLARMLARRGERARAREELQRIVREAEGRPHDRAFALEARRLLGEVGG
jgi:tetratricopeptide (TPR) repeat protein